ncbi:MAG: MarR family transcriptional regulator [Eubacteriales bacterium]|nr:MarR family transcriptional regulator [Eubacteriales bacterium]
MESRDHCAAVWDRMKRMRHIQMWKLCKGMTKAETELLHVMCRLSKKNPDIPVSQLPHICHMQTSAISRLMKKMEADGLIVRKIDPNCRRNTLVSVTEAGTEQCRRNWEEVQDFWERVLARTPEEHIDQMLCFWDEIMDNMETVIDELSQDK